MGEVCLLHSARLTRPRCRTANRCRSIFRGGSAAISCLVVLVFFLPLLSRVMRFPSQLTAGRLRRCEKVVRRKKRKQRFLMSSFHLSLVVLFLLLFFSPPLSPRISSHLAHMQPAPSAALHAGRGGHARRAVVTAM